MNENISNQEILNAVPLLPMRGLSVFPEMLINFEVIRPLSINALNVAGRGNQTIFLVAQHNIAKESPLEEDLYEVGTVCKIKQILKVPGNDVIKVLVEGVRRGKIMKFYNGGNYLKADIMVEPVDDEKSLTSKEEALLRHCINLFDEYVHTATGALSPELVAKVSVSTDPSYVSDFIAQNIYIRPDNKQDLLEEYDPITRIKLLNHFLAHENEILELELRIAESTKMAMSKQQKDYFLREQIKAIQNELGENEDEYEEINRYREQIIGLDLAPASTKKLLKEVSRLARQAQGSPESATIRTYLDTCLDVPWNKKSRDTYDTKKALKILDNEHFGLEKVKDRVVEYLAVKQLSPSLKGNVLCLVGPPGTGKTSIAMSIAHATNRKLARISLGGVHDEAEIRGHRKTYVGAMVGRIMAGLIQAKTANPVLVLDEIDKLGSDHRGDPSAALLEALDGEQNSEFRDHYLEIPYDLSDVMFITTANTLETIPRPLLDRMEVIELSSYTDEEKLQIAKKHLLPKQRKRHGLTATQLKFTDNALRELIDGYTREAGVRKLERQIASVCRKTARKIAEGECKSQKLDRGLLENLLGKHKYQPEKLNEHNEIGLVHGLAWTQVGETVLDVEVAALKGSGKLELTGNLGDVMKESAKAAVTYIRSRAKALGIDEDFYKTYDLHIHFPEGAIPKDGPSAGITMCVAIISALSSVPVNREVAMTGEISLRGRVMAIGGLKEKAMAAYKLGVKTVIIPADNERDLEDIDPIVRESLTFVPTDHVDKILSIALKQENGKENFSEFLPTVEGKPSFKQTLVQ